MTNIQPAIFFLLAIIGVALLIGLLVRSVRFFLDFRHTYRMIYTEIARTEGMERRHWIREKRRLLMSLIPFVKY